jgi:ATP-dependent Clp protease ATP-binding subunit ClpB
VDFKNTVLIMTSNLGAQALQEGLAAKGKLDAATRAEVMEQVKAHFRPEFLNRVDEIVLFEPLRESDIAQVVDLQFARLQKLAADRRLTLELTPEARTFLAREGYDPQYGARPLKRAIQRYLQDPLALKILNGDFAPGDTVQIGVMADLIKLSVKRPASA